MSIARVKRRLSQGLFLAACALVPAGLCQLLSAAPTDRTIHLESFRYGKSPSVIRCNRGDRLHLTFSTRDTGHSFFLAEFDLDAKVSPGSDEVAVYRTRDTTAPPRLLRTVVLRTELSGWTRYFVSKCQYRCHVYCGPMHAFEHGNLIIGPNTLWFAGMGLVLGIPLVGLAGVWRARLPDDSLRTAAGVDLLAALPWLRKLLKGRTLQFALAVLMLLGLYVILLTTLFGTHMPGRNLGVMLVWVVWLFALTAVLTPWGGRIWCFVCPLPVPGEILQRGAVTHVRTGGEGEFRNRFFGWRLRWPRWLANDWPRTLGFLALGTFSTVLVARPLVSGWLILGMVLVATAMALVWQLRAFCRYLCPVSAFVGLYAKAAPLALGPADATVCGDCTAYSCHKGSGKGWACPYGLSVPEIVSTSECGLCGECIKTCPTENVALRWRPFAQETAIRSFGEAWLAMGMLVLAVAYSIVHLGHWPALRDAVNILDKGNWGQFAVYALVLWTTALVLLPGVMWLLARAGLTLAGTRASTARAMLAATGALVPIGLAVWIAFVVPMLMVNVSFVLQSLSDPFGWGWDFLGTAGSAWRPLWPEAIPWIQVACVLAGLGYSLRNGWRIWHDLVGERRRALAGMLPLALSLTALAAWLVTFFAD